MAPLAGSQAPISAPTAPDALPSASERPVRTGKSLTIGAVCKLLKDEFSDISISKIRYLEDQKLLAPRRTQGGYRLYSPADVARLRTILRLQRDEFLPLRVIRQELAAGRAEAEHGADEPAAEPRPTRRTKLAEPRPEQFELSELTDYTGVDERLVRELEEYRVIKAESRDGKRFYDDLDREIVRAVGELTRYGVAPRNLRVFRTSADREAALLEQILAPALRSRNRERRGEAIEALESLAVVVSHLKHLMLVRDLRSSYDAAGMRARRSRLIGASRAEVWRVVSDPYHLARWWPKVTRVESVQERKRGTGTLWTKVLETKAGRSVRADFRCLYSKEPSTYGWEQEIEGSPFAKVLRSSQTRIELNDADGGTMVKLEAEQRLRGLSRFGGGFMLRRATGAQLDQALDGLEHALVGGDGGNQRG